MKAYQCDRCGELYSCFSKSIKREEIYITNSNTSSGCIKDLCGQCQEELEAWWKMKKKKKKEETEDGTN